MINPSTIQSSAGAAIPPRNGLTLGTAEGRPGGHFEHAIPPPLGIGTIELDDGTSAKGFLAETAGLAAATDISAYGGWRSYIARTNEIRRRLEGVPSN